MKQIMVAALLAALSAASAASEQWAFVVSGVNGEYHAQRGSVVFTKSTVSFVIRSRLTQGGDVSIHRVLTTRAECEARAGQIVFASLDLKQERFRADFAFEAGNVGSAIGQTLCAQLEHEQVEHRAPPVRVL